MPFQFRKEAIEEDLNTTFPSQGQGNPPLYYSLSEVVVPTYSINNVAEGTDLPPELQQAWDFSTGRAVANSLGVVTAINTPGFYKCDLNAVATDITAATSSQVLNVQIYDGTSSKFIWSWQSSVGGSGNQPGVVQQGTFFCYLRSGDSVRLFSSGTSYVLDFWYRQVADANGNLVNPLGYSAA